MRIIIKSNITQIAARYRRMARNLPGVVERAMGEFTRQEAIPLFEKATGTWINQPTFEAQQTPRGWKVDVDPVFPFGWVDRGTRVRYATLSRDWRSKSKPNVIAAYAGRGRVLFISRKRPRPGIVARNFTTTITMRLQPKVARYVCDVLNQASYGAGQGL